MAQLDWGWRYNDYTPSDAATARAADILRRDYRNAAAWLRQASDRTTLPLPAGNGTNGPWERVACITPAGRLGVLDIAAGAAVEYDAVVPRCVRRFAMEHENGVSPHRAGGSGGKPSTWRQIAVVIGDGVRNHRIHAPQNISPLRVIYGLSTCYGTIGVDPREGWRDEWKFAAPEWVETDEPQQEEVLTAEKETWDKFVAQRKFRAGEGTITCDGRRVYVTGMPHERRVTMDNLRREWPKFLAIEVARGAYDTLAQNGQHVRWSGTAKTDLGYLSGGARCDVEDVIDHIASMVAQ